MVWSHVYDPLGSQFLSTLLALVPLAVLLGLLAFAGAFVLWTGMAFFMPLAELIEQDAGVTP